MMIIQHYKAGWLAVFPSEGSVCLVIISGSKVIVYRAKSPTTQQWKTMVTLQIFILVTNHFYFYSTQRSIFGQNKLAILPRFAFCVQYQSLAETIENATKLSSEKRVESCLRGRESGEGGSSLRISSREVSLGGRAVLLGYASLPARQGD